MRQLLTILFCLLGLACTMQAQQPRMRGESFQTETPMVHDPVMTVIPGRTADGWPELSTTY